MSGKNIAFVQKSLRRFRARGHRHHWSAAWRPTSSGTSTAGVRTIRCSAVGKDRAEVREFFRGIAEHQEAKTFSPRDFFASEDRVFVLGHYAWTMRKTGRDITCDWMHVFTIRGDQVTGFREFTDTAQFVAAYRD